MSRFPCAWALLVALICGLAIVGSYHPGLAGGFLFDDFANLPAIGATGPIDNWSSFFRYITSGTADPTGRPLALLSFLIDAHDWPADPRAFKITNLAIHLCNAAMLAVLLVQLGKRQRWGRERPQQAMFAGILGAAIWALHPLFVSTTMYIVQREAMLPASFTLMGLLAWIQAVEHFRTGKPLAGWAWAIFSACICTTLATLSKANGILLPTLIWIVDAMLTAAARQQDDPEGGDERRHIRIARLLLVIVPTLLVATYLLSTIPGAIAGTSARRPWSWGERTLTEGRVLWNYLELLIVPRPFTAGLFNDQVAASRDALHPWTTLPAWLGLGLITWAAWRYHKRLPWLCAPWLFFMAAHVMESSIIPLELYYEHRNYLPAMLLFWPLAIFIVRWQKPVVARFAISALLLSTLATMTHARNALWGNGAEQALVWAAINPDSPRAQVTAAQFEMRRGRPDLAQARLVQAFGKYPLELQIAFNLIAADCGLGNLPESHIDATRRAALNATAGQAMTYRWLNEKLPSAQSGACKGLDAAFLRSVTGWLAQNPNFTRTSALNQDLLHANGMIALFDRHPDAALDLFNQALEKSPAPEVALNQAAALGRAGYPELGLQHLARYSELAPAAPKARMGMPRIHQWVLKKQGYWQNELAALKLNMEDDLRSPSSAELAPDTPKQ